MKKLSLIVSLVVGLCIAAAGPALGDKNDDAKKARKALMKGISKTNKALRAANKDGDLAAVEKNALALQTEFGKIANPCLFLKGSSGKGSRAKPAIWENWSDFEAKAKKAGALASAVATQAKMGKAEETGALVKALGKEACNSCHKPYRKPKPKKK